MEVAEHLIAKGATIDAKEIYEFTPLILAAQEGHLKVVELLVSNKADINFTTNDGGTALHMASQEGHLDLCRYLKSEGCDITIKSKYGTTALDVAAHHVYASKKRRIEMTITSASSTRAPTLVGAASGMCIFIFMEKLLKITVSQKIQKSLENLDHEKSTLKKFLKSLGVILDLCKSRVLFTFD